LVTQAAVAGAVLVGVHLLVGVLPAEIEEWKALDGAGLWKPAASPRNAAHRMATVAARGFRILMVDDEFRFVTREVAWKMRRKSMTSDS
jgi:hypothetical protein